MKLGYITWGGNEPYDPAIVDRELDLARNGGAEWVRMVIDWRVSEPVEGQVDLSMVQPALDHAWSLGFKVCPMVANSPDWARAPVDRGAPLMSLPGNDADFANFCRAVVEQTGLATMQLWNEQNTYWYSNRQGGVTPQRYAALFKAARAAILAVNPSATIVQGATAYDANQIEWQKGFRDETKGLSYVAACHLYSYDLADVVSRCTARYDALKQAVGTRALWITESGFSDQRAGEADQADTLSRLFDAYRARSVPVAFCYRLRDMETTGPFVGYGTVRRDFTPKAAYQQILA